MKKQSLPLSLAQGLLGIIILITAFFILLQDEVSSLQNYIALKNIKNDLIPVKNTNIDPDNDDELIFTSGELDAQIITDEDFQIQIEAITLRRVVEIYQWEEHVKTKTKKDAEKKKYKQHSYTYKQEWDEKLIDSSEFYSKNYQNPTKKKYKNILYKTKTVSLGDFEIESKVVVPLSKPTTINLESYFRSLKKYQKLISQTHPDADIPDVEFEKYPEEFQVIDNYFYLGEDIDDPEVGDIRISFQVIEPFPISIVGRQNGNKIDEFDYAFKEILIAKKGLLKSKDFLKLEKRAKYKNAILLGTLAFVLMYVGFFLIKIPFRKVILMIPYFGVLIAFSSLKRFCLIALLLTTLLAGITWLPYLPMLSLSLITISFVALVIMRNMDYEN